MNRHHLESREYIEDEWLSPPKHSETSGSGREEDTSTGERPTKIRKQQHPQTVPSLTAKNTKQKEIVLNSDSFVRLYGFSPTEFLPLFPKAQHELDPTLYQTLCEDLLGKCLFGGYLNTLETVRLATVSKGFQVMAREYVQRLDLSRLRRLHPFEVRNIVARYPNVTDLNFDYCAQFGDGHLHELSPLSSLEHLSLRGSRVTGCAVSALLKTLASKSLTRKATSLVLLDLSATCAEQSMNIGDEVVKSIAKYCPKLQILRLEWCKAITDDGLEALVHGSPMALTQVDLSLTCITNQGLSALQRLVHSCPITTLDVSASKIHADALLASLAAINAPVALTDLKLEFLPDLSVQQMTKFFISVVSHRLGHFQMSHCTPSTSETTAQTVRQVIQAALGRNRNAAC